MTTEKEMAEIVQRNRSLFIEIAGLDAGRTDYSLRHDLLRLIELADILNPGGVQTKAESGKAERTENK